LRAVVPPPMEQIVTMPLMNRRSLLLGAFGLPAFSFVACAGTGLRYSARLVGGETKQQNWRAGLDITLDKGWKTYWRVPGDAGVPPQFDWSRSHNVKSVTVLWPAPTRFTDEGGESIGYKNRVVFPMDVVADDPAQPIDLALDALLGVCEKICIPVKLEMSLVQSKPEPADASLIAAFAARVPRRVDAESPFRVANASLIETEGKFDLDLRLEGKGFDKDLDIFVEGSDFVYFRSPRPVSEKGTVLLRVDGLKGAQELKRRALNLTMTAGDIRLEQDVMVD
jgi:DsbC/DsbD-like thiol-disulfide interchange protein